MIKVHYSVAKTFSFDPVVEQIKADSLAILQIQESKYKKVTAGGGGVKFPAWSMAIHRKSEKL